MRLAQLPYDSMPMLARLFASSDPRPFPCMPASAMQALAASCHKSSLACSAVCHTKTTFMILPYVHRYFLITCRSMIVAQSYTVSAGSSGQGT